MGTKADNTKKRIADVAAELFAHDSFDRVSVRQIATQAGVDPALINHHFGGKEGLFNYMLSGMIAQNVSAAHLETVPLDELGRYLVDYSESIWSSEAANVLSAVMRRALSSSTSVATDIVSETLLAVIAQRLPGEPDEQIKRASLAGTHMSGLILTRHLLKVPAIVAIDSQDLGGLIGPQVQHYLTGELGEESS